MTRFRIPTPVGGVSSEEALVDQEKQTTRLARNVRHYDPRSKRNRLSQRAGSRKYAAAQVSGAAKVAALLSVNYDARNQTYSQEAPGGEPTISSQQSPSNPGLVPIIRHDSLGNRYFVDGKSTVVKQNVDGVVVWLLPLPIKQAQTQVRALWIDDDDMVYVGTSAGLSQEKCKIWKYRQAKNDKTELVWSVDTDAFVEDLAIRNGKLCTIQNSSRDQSAALVIYDGLFFPAGPIEVWRHKIGYPGNCIAINPLNASILVASQANANRGVMPDDPLLSQTSFHWTPDQLPFWSKRAWCWLDARDVDGDGTFNASYDDGSPISLWSDKTENGRHLYARTGAGLAEPTLNRRGAAAQDCIRMDDGLSGTNVNAFVSRANTSVDRSGAAQQGTLLPGFIGAGWALFIVCRSEAVGTIRQLIIQNIDGAGAYDALDAGARDIGLFSNAKRDPAALPAGRVAAAGGYLWNDSNSRIGAVAGQPMEQYGSHEPVDPWEQTDLSLITLIYDGTPQGNVGPENCTLRVDGKVAQVFHIGTAKAWAGPTEIGQSVNAVGGSTAFRGQLCEIIVLRDYQATVGGPRLIIDTTWTSGTAFPSELHLMEGYLAHGWGISHKLPIGAHGAVRFPLNVLANDTVTIAGQVYRFVAAMPGVANDVLLGANLTISATNLGNAINKIEPTGVASTTFNAGTARNASVTALRSYLPTITNVALVLISRSPSSNAFTVVESTAGVRMIAEAGTDVYRSGDNGPWAHQIHPFWYQPNALTIGGPPVDLGVNTTSPEGLLTNEGPLLAKYEPSRGEVKWVVTNPTTTNLGVGGIGFGVACSKLGYIVSMGPISSTAVAGATADQLRETYAVFRGILDNGDSVVVDHTLVGTGTFPWVQTNGSADPPVGPFYSPQYPYPRPDTDPFDNFYFPWSSLYTTYGMVKLAWNQGTGRITATTQPTFPSFQRACGVSIDPGIPDYSPDNPNLAEFTDSACFREMIYTLTSTAVQPGIGTTVTIGAQVYQWNSPAAPVGNQVQIGATVTLSLANLKNAINGGPGAGADYSAAIQPNPQAGAISSNATTVVIRAANASVPLTLSTTAVTLSWSAGVLDENVIQRKRHVKTTPFAGSPRTHMLIAVAGADIKRATGGVIAALAGGNGSLDATAQYISHAVVRGKAYITDGLRKSPMVVDPKLFSAVPLTADSGGQVPAGCKLLASWGDRLVMARALGDSSGLYLSEKGKPTGWNFKPNAPTPRQAFDLRLPNSSGSVPDTIQGLRSITDDLLIVTCQGSVHRVSGDPALGGVVHEITTATGGAFGDRGITKDEKGTIYFASFPEAGVWAMPPGGYDPVSITGIRIMEDLSSIDWATTTLEVHWDPQREGLWLVQVPYANPGTQMQRWFWQRKDNAWWPDDDIVPTSGPTTMCVLDADQEAHRGLILGGSDGYIRIVDDDARNDDGRAIRAECLLGPLAPEESEFEFTFDDLGMVLATEQDGLAFEVFATADPSDLGLPKASGTFARGRGNYQNCRSTASYVGVLVKNFATNERFSLESISIDAWRAGIKRRALR